MRGVHIFGQNRFGFHCLSVETSKINKLRSDILFAFAQKRSTPWVTTIAVFDTDRDVLLHLLKEFFLHLVR